MSTRRGRSPWVFLLLALAATAIAQNPPAPQLAQPPGQGTLPAEGLRIEPKNSQSAEQLWTDRYACHTWSRSQSGFDPTHPAAGMAADEITSRREQYRRAMTACLEARGYSVREAPAPAPAAPPAPAAGAPLPQPQAAAARLPQVAEFRYHPLAARLDVGYTLVEGALKPTLDDGAVIGLGLAWFPSSALPLGVRVEASYSRFEETLQSLNAASVATGTNVAFGHQNVYGGDADLQLDLAHGPRVKGYVFGGAGWYRQQTVFKQVSPVYGVICYYYCGPGYFWVVSTVERSTSSWLKSWNAGLGIEFALEDPATLFIEARYLRIAPYSSDQAYIPIVIGLRF